MTANAAHAANAAAVAEAQRASGVYQFEIEGGDGKPHAYLVQLHGVDEGQAIVFALIAVGGEPLGALLQGAAGKLIAEGGGLAELLEKDVTELLSGIDFAAVGRDLSLAVARSDMPGLVNLILKNTHRDGRPLRDSNERNAAYRGNYGEMLRAVWQVISANRFLPF